VAVQVALVREASGGGGRGDRLARFEQAASGAYAVGEVEGVGREAGAFAEEAHEPELANAGGDGELVEADVSLGPIGEVVAGCAKRAVVTGAER
jgi:hypothetical protein